MKTLGLILPAFWLIAGCALPPANTTKTEPRTEVIFDNPEKFTDVKDSSIPTDKGRDSILFTIRGFLVDRSASLLPDGYKLKIVFTDIDLAGDFEPWRGGNWVDVRIVRSVYPPAFKFTYTVTDPAGKVVKEGAEDIRDVTFETRLVTRPDDPLHYEKDILDDWMRLTLRGLKKP